MRTFVVVGAGMAGAAAVQGLREEGFEDRLVLIGDEPLLPYERPPLSKEYLAGEHDAPTFVHEEAWYEEQRVELLLGRRVERIDPAGASVELDGGERLPADAVLLATGGRPRRFPSQPDHERVLDLRTLEDADRLRAFLKTGVHLLVVGAGFIGSEVAATARGLGAEVTVVDVFGVPLERALGKEVGRIFADIQREHGVDLRMGSGVASIEADAGGARVRTEAGDLLEGDAVLIGIGIEPNVDLAAAAGAAIDNGVLVDGSLRTSVENLYATGDVANHEHPLFGRLRVEHFDSALKQGPTAARAMLGKPEPHADPHWFWSDQYEHNLQMAGIVGAADKVVTRGSMEERSFVRFSLEDGVLNAALGLNRGKDVRRALKLIGSRPDPAALIDEDLDLRTLA